jgi:hypothetical protein
MLGWLTQKTHHTSWRTFSEFGQRLLVANANNDTAEHTLGVDLIYYNVSRGSMILVQYKKLDAKNNGSFYPGGDSNLADEIQRMHALDRYVTANRSPHDDFRLEPSPCWVKLCQDQAYIPQTADMIPGMYFSLDHFQHLRDDPRLKGPQGGVRFAYDNVPSYPRPSRMMTRFVTSASARATATRTLTSSTHGLGTRSAPLPSVTCQAALQHGRRYARASCPPLLGRPAPQSPSGDPGRRVRLCRKGRR